MKVKNIKYHKEFENGCETCDWGSQYISNISFEIENHKIEINTEQMYNYTLTEEDFMKLFGECNDLNNFYEKMFDLIATKSYDIESRVGLEDMLMTINGISIDIYESCKHGEPIEMSDEDGEV